MSRFIRQARILVRALAVVMALVAVNSAGNADAAPLDLSLQTTPNLVADFIDVNYVAASKSFTAQGYAEQITNGSTAPATIVNGTFTITATIDNDGNVTSGTLTINGEVPSLSVAPGLLLNGTLQAHGLGEAGGPIEFQFATTDGALASQFGPVLKVILTFSGYQGSMLQDFTSNSIAVAGIGW
ncbi:hypothetical protein [Geomesophilobacter sediminis]|uniref:DUF4402 domain-containing protein n=1 Tax=Geomesophilobacter sediminis TaxID=2798584 RepID=A0A8J7JKA3_9BACT|nr:hypothetical protein [Geomesophilobacter sediminis]MBJ6723710.1 hypothetical protein [Geomesophilobacter sediminis]